MAKSRKGLKICCGVTALIVIILIVVAIILFFTVFKPKQPDIYLQSVTLQTVKFLPFVFLNVSLGITVKIDNPNYGSFKYKDSTTYVTYHGTDIAEAPIEHDTIPARGTHDISTNVVIEGEKVLSNPSFVGDSLAGVFNFTTSTTMQGKATALKIFKIKAKSINTCEISVFPFSQNVTAVCTAKIKY